MLSVRVKHELTIWCVFAAFTALSHVLSHFESGNVDLAKPWIAILAAQSLRAMYFMVVHSKRQIELRRQREDADLPPVDSNYAD